MDNLRDELITAFKNGKLLEDIDEKARENWKNTDVLVDEIIKVHNDGEIDVIASFKTLKNETNSGVNFFSVWHILEKALSQLEAPVSEVMECVLNLIHEAGQDMPAGTLLPSFTDYCTAKVSRPKDACALIEKFGSRYVDLLPQVIVAGCRLNIEFYLNEAIRLARYDDIEIRRRAVFSLGRIEYLKKNNLISQAISCLELSLVQETDDPLLGGLIRSAFNLYKHIRLQEERVTNIINQALTKGDDFALHAGTELFGFDCKELPEALLDCLLSQLLRVKPENKGSLKNIDYGLSALVEQENWKAIDFLENLLLANPEKLSINVFDSAMRCIFKNQDNILNQLMTRWFVKGNRVLCDGIREIVNLAYDDNVQLTVEASEFDSSNPDYLIFMARKAIGYLSSTPVTATSIIVSLMRYATDKTMQILINLLLDFLLINYPGKVGDYLKQKVEIETGEVKKALETILKLFDDYLTNIKSTGNIPELHPSQSQRDTYNRRFSRLMSNAMKEAQKDSAFLSLVSTSVLLYGRKSIDYVYKADGQSNRMEIPLHSHSTEMEFPRFEIIDPFGLDYMLRVFRAEQIKL
jgi:hypothetical protein